MNKLSEKIKKIRMSNGLSQEELAKELGYNSRSTINKIEKGINEISYDKLMLLVNKYNLDIDDLMENDSTFSFKAKNSDSNLFISFSARDGGNSTDIIKYLISDNDRTILFKDIFYNPCSKCHYECFTSKCKYRNDDIYELLQSTKEYKNIIFVVPMYGTNPSSLFFILSERMQDYFNENSSEWTLFTRKLYFVSIYGSNEETPHFNEHFEMMINSKDDYRILKIERHKYNLDINDKVIENDEIKLLLNRFKISIL